MTDSPLSLRRRQLLAGSAGALAGTGLIGVAGEAVAQAAAPSAAAGSPSLPAYVAWKDINAVIVHNPNELETRRSAFGTSAITSTDHLYVHPRGGGDLIGAEIAAARQVGLRFHPTRGSMTRSVKDGGLPPDSVVQDDDEVLADSERLVAAFHDPRPGAMVRVALAPCSPFSV